MPTKDENHVAEGGNKRQSKRIILVWWSVAMPKYYFEVTDGQNWFKDREGAVLADEANARAYTAQIANELIAIDSELVQT